MTQQQLKKQAQDILRRHSSGQDLQGDDLLFIQSLADSYVYNPETVVTYGVDTSPQSNTQCFVAVHRDGSRVPFSYIRAVAAAKGSTRNYDVMRCFRSAISAQMVSRKQQNRNRVGRVRCEGTGTFVPWSEAEVHHHEVSFFELVTAFVKREGLVLEAIVVEVGIDCVNFSDSSLAERWYDFHQEHAKLIVWSKAHHQEHHRKGSS